MSRKVDTLDLREQNKVLHDMQQLTGNAAFETWFALRLCQYRRKAQEAYNAADLHDAVLAADLRGMYKAFDLLAEEFENIKELVKKSDLALGNALQSKRGAWSDAVGLPGEKQQTGG